MFHLSSKGFSIIEIIIACAIFLSTIAAFMAASDLLKSMAVTSEEKTAAALLLEEGAEAVLLLRDQGWVDHISTLDLESPHYLYWDGDSYVTAASAVPISNDYWRRVTFFEVRRDGSGAYADTGTIDPDTRRARVEIGRLSDDEVLAAGEMLVHNVEE